MSKQTTPAQAIFPWLRANLGKHALAPLTSLDAACLKAAVEIMNAHCHAGTREARELETAFRNCVMCMQPQCREFAYHAIAHVKDWPDRAFMWHSCQLPPINNPQRCQYES